jgi:hypothetical protein
LHSLLKNERACKTEKVPWKEYIMQLKKFQLRPIVNGLKIFQFERSNQYRPIKMRKMGNLETVIAACKFE